MTNTLPADRRSFLTAGMATVFAVSAASPVVAHPASPRAAWDAAMARHLAADAAYEPHIDEIYPPEHLRKELSSSYRALMDTPAPDRAALKWKLDEVFMHEVDEDCLLADIIRLLGDS